MATAAHRKTRRRRWLLLLIPSVDAANWAQTTGALRQNLAVPYGYTWVDPVAHLPLKEDRDDRPLLRGE